MAHKQGRKSMKNIGSRKQRKLDRHRKPVNTSDSLEFSVHGISEDNRRRLQHTVGRRQSQIVAIKFVHDTMIVDIDLKWVPLPKHSDTIVTLKANIQSDIRHRVANPERHPTSVRS